MNEILDFTGLQHAADSRFNTYSTGMRQMLALGRALLTDAEIIFVDEPTRSLDPRAAERIRRFLREELVDRQKRTVFWATHNLIEAKDYAHELAIIDKGRITFHGSVADLVKDDRNLQALFERATGGGLRDEESGRDGDFRE